MARFSRIQVISRMYNPGIVPILYHPDPEICYSVLKSVYEGGLRIFEFTNRGDFAHEIFSEIFRKAANEMPDMILGTGTVLDSATASLYMQLGSNFIVSPVLNEDIALVCNRRKVLWIPGCGSVTEISRSEELGAEIVKIFPALSVGGPEFVRAIKGPQPWTSIMPTQGVDPTEQSLSEWFDAGVSCIGMGPTLFTPQILAKLDWNQLTSNVKYLIKIWNKVRS